MKYIIIKCLLLTLTFAFFGCSEKPLSPMEAEAAFLEARQNIKGEGVPINYKKAVRLWEQAAKVGHEKSIDALIEYYRNDNKPDKENYWIARSWEAYCENLKRFVLENVSHEIPPCASARSLIFDYYMKEIPKEAKINKAELLRLAVTVEKNAKLKIKDLSKTSKTEYYELAALLSEIYFAGDEITSANKDKAYELLTIGVEENDMLSICMRIKLFVNSGDGASAIELFGKKMQADISKEYLLKHTLDLMLLANDYKNAQIIVMGHGGRDHAVTIAKGLIEAGEYEKAMQMLGKFSIETSANWNSTANASFHKAELPLLKIACEKTLEKDSNNKDANYYYAYCFSDRLPNEEKSSSKFAEQLKKASELGDARANYDIANNYPANQWAEASLYYEKALDAGGYMEKEINAFFKKHYQLDPESIGDVVISVAENYKKAVDLGVKYAVPYYEEWGPKAEIAKLLKDVGGNAFFGEYMQFYNRQVEDYNMYHRAHQSQKKFYAEKFLKSEEAYMMRRNKMDTLLKNYKEQVDRIPAGKIGIWTTSYKQYKESFDENEVEYAEMKAEMLKVVGVSSSSASSTRSSSTSSSSSSSSNSNSSNTTNKTETQKAVEGLVDGVTNWFR